MTSKRLRGMVVEGGEMPAHLSPDLPVQLAEAPKLRLLLVGENDARREAGRWFSRDQGFQLRHVLAQIPVDPAVNRDQQPSGEILA